MFIISFDEYDEFMACLGAGPSSNREYYILILILIFFLIFQVASFSKVYNSYISKEFIYFFIMFSSPIQLNRQYVVPKLLS